MSRTPVRAMQAEKRRRQILERARDVFAEKGYHLATIDDIVQRAEIARGTFYLYFEEKRAIFEELVDRFTARLYASISRIDVTNASRSPVAQLRDNLARVVQVAIDDPAMTKILFNVAIGSDPSFDRKLLSFYGALQQLVEESLAEGQQLGLVRPGDRQAMAALGLGAVKELLVQSVTGKLDLGAETLADETMRFVASGILAPDAVIESALGRGSTPAAASAAAERAARKPRRAGRL